MSEPTEKKDASSPAQQRPAAFAEQLALIAEPQLSEPFSEKTEKLRNIVCALGLLIILTGTGAIQFSASSETGLLGLSFTGVSKDLVLCLGGGIELILTAQLCWRMHLERERWKIGKKASAWQVLELANELDARFAELQHRKAHLQHELEQHIATPILDHARHREDMSRREAEIRGPLRAICNSVEADQNKQLADHLEGPLAVANRSWRWTFWCEMILPLVFAAGSMSSIVWHYWCR